jgi:hypothetical protein
MSRVINTFGPGKRRNQLRRTSAEILRRMALKRELDSEARDMAAALVYCLRGIDETIDSATDAWEKRNYYLKADRFRLQWEWVLPAARRLEELVVNDRWEKLPEELAKLAPHFADITIAKMTRSASVWESRYSQLKQEKQ